MARVELLETVEDNKIRACRSQPLRAQACLRQNEHLVGDFG
jgi:hypothetical protein